MAFLKGAKGEAWVTCVAQFAETKVISIPFDVKFKIEKTPVAQELLKRAQTGELNDVQFMQSVVLDWRNVLDDENNPVAFSSQELADLMEVVQYKNALLKGYMRRQFAIDVENP